MDQSLAVPKHKVPEIDGDEFKQLVGTACIIDIRTPKLYGAGTSIKQKFGPNADFMSPEYRKKYFLKIPMSRLAKQYTKIPRDRRIVVFDFRGKQCQAAARFLIEKGF